jgi:hypothetical protein
MTMDQGMTTGNLLNSCSMKNIFKEGMCFTTMTKICTKGEKNEDYCYVINSIPKASSIEDML